MSTRSTTLMASVLAWALGAMTPMDAEEWRYISPQIRSQVQTLDSRNAIELLTHVCRGKIQSNQYGPGFSCSVEQFGRNFDFGSDFHAESIIFGHFIHESSQDVLVSGWSVEAHPALWRGSLLLTHEKGGWRPVWYKSSVITRACEKVALASGREILLCEEEDAGMGHEVHYVFTVDALDPVDSRERLLVTADSFQKLCLSVQRQTVERIWWETTDGQRGLNISLLHGSRRLSNRERERCEATEEVPAPAVSRRLLRFVLTDQGLRSVQ